MSRRQNRPAFFATSALLVSALCTVAAAKTIYVDDDATGANNGSSWTDAYTFLQESLADANSAEKPVEIRVAQGIYKPNEGLVAIPEFDWRTATFQLISGVTLKGGYAGFAEPDPNAHNIGLYETILSGDISSPDDIRDNSYHVMTGSGTDSSAVIEDFIVTGGQADGPQLNDRPEHFLRVGGGIYNSFGSPMITNCTFSNNRALYGGGGMYNYGSNPVLTDCVFKENIGDGDGGGIFNFHSSPTLTNCNFSGNRAESTGGAIHNRYSYLILTDCIFAGNSGDGGAISNGHTSATITNCIFTDNHAPYRGGGIYNAGESGLTMTNSRLTGNTAGAAGIIYGTGGGILSRDGSSMALTNCTITGNRAGLIYGMGGGLCIMNDAQSSDATLTNCTFTGNSAPNGHALACSSSSQDFPSTVQLTDCILWDDGNEVWNGDDSTITIAFSNVQGLIGGRLGLPNGNIVEDPCFTEPGRWDANEGWIDGDYHLKSQAGRWDPVGGSWVKDDVTSPCIDAGDPNSDWTSETWPHGGRINMGAYGGTREASMSIQPQEMSLPYVAYIHERDAEAAESFRSLFVSYGCSATLIRLDEVVTTPLDSYDLVIVGNDTGMLSSWGESDSVAAIENSGKPILGLGEGGYAFFGKLGLEIGWPNGMHGSRDSIEVIDPNNSLFSVPYAIDVPDDRVLQLYTETEHVDLHLWPMPETVTALGRQVESHGYYPLAREYDRYVLWGFTESPEKMTHVGKTLFVNVVIRAANAAW